MESLLSLAFTNISARDSGRIRKGLRQIEGLLAQICLSSAKLSPHKRRGSDGREKGEDEQTNSKRLGVLRKDAAFREFFRLQEGFQWNVAGRLIATLERLLGMGNAASTDLVILSALDVLQGVLLLHPPSRSLFEREDYMNLLLDLLDYSNPPAIQSQAVLVLVTALLDCPRNTRVFEQVDGLLTVTSLFKSRGTTKDVKMRTLEFLYFYLMPERGPASSNSAPNLAALHRNPNKPARHARTHSNDASDGMEMDIDTDEQESDVKGTDEKQRLLGRYLTNVDELVQDLRESTAFATVVG
ncbi:Hypothetical protein R9X50_00529700 [Acrodontium crateriforme]|uniref:Cell division control protein 14 n=1 Tax=Acrodontium crateriforme TaxID=150365 RepID=A0AAQ3M794_9PEZI|nr:Hypothetical protein R9X50_00529700 [Acrodontium crateriforme]